MDRYSTMTTLQAVKNLPVGDMAASDAHLYLWVPNALLPDGLAVLDAWEFRYVTNLVWAKHRKDGGPDGRGVGFYFRNVTELLLFAVRGSMRTLSPARSRVNMLEPRKPRGAGRKDGGSATHQPHVSAKSATPQGNKTNRVPARSWRDG